MTYKALILFVMSMASAAYAHHTVLTTPTKRLPTSQYPQFADDMDFENMDLAIDRQIVRFEQRSLSGRVRYGRDVYPERRLLETIREFQIDTQAYRVCLVRKSRESCSQQFQALITNKYNVYVPDLAPGDPRYGEEKDTFFTAYYTPTLKGSNRPTSDKPHGVFSKPTSKSLSESSRDEIDFQKKLDGTGYDVFYTEDLFDLYLLQVQGGGKVEMDNGEDFYISYDGTNGQTWRWISLYMRDQGYITDLSIEAQREFLLANPDKQREIYAYCPSYVYFKPTPHPPEGSDLVSLTDGRSIATDYRLYKRKGALAFVRAIRPDPNREGAHYIPFSRFMLDQDTGGAIEGKGRVDLYHGEGDYAERAAYSTNHTGNLYFLMLKNQ
ncbi:MAG: MltA domain-containing protein [Pseudomonadota bacterium]